MKALAFVLLFAGFVIVMSAFVLLSERAPRAPFIVAGLAIQLFGLFCAFRAHFTLDGGR